MGSDENNERLNKLEDTVRKTQDSLLIISRDMHQMNEAIMRMAKSLETLVEVQKNIKIIEERSESRHNVYKESEKHLHARIDAAKAECKPYAEKADNGDKAYKTLVFVAKTLGGAALVTLFGLFLYIVKLKG